VWHAFVAIHVVFVTRTHFVLIFFRISHENTTQLIVGARRRNNNYGNNDNYGKKTAAKRRPCERSATTRWMIDICDRCLYDDTMRKFLVNHCSYNHRAPKFISVCVHTIISVWLKSFFFSKRIFKCVLTSNKFWNITSSFTIIFWLGFFELNITKKKKKLHRLVFLREFFEYNNLLIVKNFNDNTTTYVIVLISDFI
jgi:hypothetical protein